MLNGFKQFWFQIAAYYFSEQDAVDLARNYYQQIADCAARQLEFEVQDQASQPFEDAIQIIREYGIASGTIWQRIKNQLPADLIE